DHDTLRVSRVTDNWDRYAEFKYEDPGDADHLTGITDVGGLTTTFSYTGDFVSSMTTPYGVTTFMSGLAGGGRWLPVSEPENAKPLFYYSPSSVSTLPDSYPLPDTSLSGQTNTFENQELSTRNSFYWNPRQFASLPLLFQGSLVDGLPDFSYLNP